MHFSALYSIICTKTRVSFRYFADLTWSQSWDYEGKEVSAGISLKLGLGFDFMLGSKNVISATVGVGVGLSFGIKDKDIYE